MPLTAALGLFVGGVKLEGGEATQGLCLTQARPSGADLRLPTGDILQCRMSDWPQLSNTIRSCPGPSQDDPAHPLNKLQRPEIGNISLLLCLSLPLACAHSQQRHISKVPS